MGATASRSTHLVTTTRIDGYSMLREPRSFDSIVFRDLRWNLKVYPRRFNELGRPDGFVVSVEIDDRSRDRLLLGSPLRNNISIYIEILDETGEHAIFDDDSSSPWFTPGGDGEGSMLFLSRRELEASSCVRNGSFTARCTMMTTKQAAKQNFSRSEEEEFAALEDTMVGSYTLTIGSFFKLKAGLRDWERAHSTRFAVGRCTWHLQFYPDDGHGFAYVFLVRASKADGTPTTAEFSFEFEGMVNFRSRKMTHIFHHANFQHFFRYKLEPAMSSAMHDDRLLVRCHLAVIVPPAAIPIQDTIPSTESVLTPLLSAMYD